MPLSPYDEAHIVLHVSLTQLYAQASYVYIPLCDC